MKSTGYSSDKNLILFFVITLLWTWIAGFIPVIFGLTGTTLGTVIFYSGGGAPSIVGVIFVFTTYPKAARREYFSRCLSIKRMGLKWPIWTILYFSVIAVIAVFISVVLLHMQIPKMVWLKMVAAQPYLLPVLLFFSLISGPFNEEFGWRGLFLRQVTRSPWVL